MIGKARFAPIQISIILNVPEHRNKLSFVVNCFIIQLTVVNIVINVVVEQAYRRMDLVCIELKSDIPVKTSLGSANPIE